MKILLAAIALFTLAGCAITPTTTGQNLLKARNVGTTPASADRAFYATLAGCQTVLQGFESQSNTLKWWGVGLQTAGGILGSILLPVAVARGMANSVVVALGASAGFANTEISVVRNEGLGAADVLATRAGVLTAMQAALTKYLPLRAATPLDYAKLQGANDELTVACLSYSLASPSAAALVAPGGE
jgi:hypothetical protein